MVILPQFTKTIEFTFFEFADVLEVRAHQLAEAIGFTVPDLALVAPLVRKLIATLSCASAVLPLARVDISRPELSAALTMLFSINKMASIHVARLQT